MRVATSSFPNSLIDHLGKLTARQQQLHAEAATGQKVRLPEDQPAAVRRILDLQAEAKAIGQYRSNIARLQEQSTVSYDAMKSLKRVSDRAGELAVLADGSRVADQLQAYAAEVDSMIEEALRLANSTHEGQFIFGGTKNDQPPFVAVRDADGKITGVTFQGGDSVTQVEIAPGSTLTAQVLGGNTSGSGPGGLLLDDRSGADLFNHLISLRDHLLAGDTGAINSIDLPQLRRDEENFLVHFGDVGAVQTRLETVSAMLKDQSVSLEGFVSQEADADLAETLVRLNQTQTAYRAALQSGAGLLQQSLLDFLR